MSKNDSRVNARKDTKVIYTCASSSSKDVILSTSPIQRIPISSSVVHGNICDIATAPTVKIEPDERQCVMSNLSPEVSIQCASSSKPRQESMNESVLTIATTRKRKLHTRHISSSSLDLSDAQPITSVKKLCRIEGKKHNFESGSSTSNSSVGDEDMVPLSLTTKKEDSEMDNILNEDKSRQWASDGASQSEDGGLESSKMGPVKGGYESTEDYTYIRGKGMLARYHEAHWEILSNSNSIPEKLNGSIGRGKYVCDACGIRCKKPSMLRKHLKTHTDQRPYKCTLCNFR